MAPESTTLIRVRDYDLATTLTSGQAFRWELKGGAWEGVIGSHWVRLRQLPEGIQAETAEAQADWSWLTHYLQTDVDLATVLTSFPEDPTLRASANACRGLRLLRQEPWECLASFILSSTKQIVQIQQIVGQLCERFGSPLAVPRDHPPAWSFPTAERLASATEAQLRSCKMGFRAPYLLKTAQMVARGEVELDRVRELPQDAAREELLKLPGVGDKIASCVLLFAYGFPQAFPVDVWVMRALRTHYFAKRRPKPADLRRFITSYFGAQAGYAQQYLFHYMRRHRGSL